MYEAYFKLSAKPFLLSPDPRAFFGSRVHRRAMSYLRYGLSQGEGFIVVTGAIGTGKTTLIRTLFQELARENVVAAQLVSTQLEPEDLLRMVSAAFGLSYEGLTKATLLRNLETFLLARAREGRRALLVVDEVQNLSVPTLEELRMLSNFQLAERSLLQSILVGQDEFEVLLDQAELEQLRQRVIAHTRLTPLDADELRGYVEHRLNVVGWQNDPEFGADAYAAIHAHTRGIPRLINTLCDRLLLYCFIEQTHRVEAGMIAAVLRESGETPPVIAAADPAAALPPPAAATAGLGAVTEARLALLEDRVSELEARLQASARALASGRLM